MNRQLIVTADGSPSFRIEDLKETYHSRHGALTESQYVYIDMGLCFWNAKPHSTKTCRIFEMGFGTGINTLLTYQNAKKLPLDIHYYTIEKYPLSQEEINLLAQSNLIDSPSTNSFFKKIHGAHWGTRQSISPHFTFLKEQQDLFQHTFLSTYDLIYYDAFGAHAQPELWSDAALKPLCAALAPGGVWVSYCAKGSVRRLLESFGLHVERLEGPPGKREMLRATKTE